MIMRKRYKMPMRLSFSVLLLVVCSRAAVAQSPPQPPVAAQHEHISVWHGEKVNDPFFWLREKSNPAVIKYLEAENAYTESLTKGLKPSSDSLYQEMLGHIKQTDQNVPVRRGEYFYYSRTEEGKQYPIRCRKKVAAAGSSGGDGPEEVLLDANELAKGLKFLSVGSFEVSDDAHSLAYTTDTTGFRQYRLSVKDLRTGAILPDTAERVTSVAWSTDNRTLFYTTEDPLTKRSNMVWRHALGDESEPVYQEKDRLFTLNLARSKDRKMLFLRATSTDTHEVRYLPSDQPNGTFEVRAPATKGPQVQRRAPRRPLLHSHQPRRQELPPGDRAGLEPVAGKLEGARTAPQGRAPPGSRIVSELPGRVRKIGGARTFPCA